MSIMPAPMEPPRASQAGPVVILELATRCWPTKGSVSMRCTGCEVFCRPAATSIGGRRRNIELQPVACNRSRRSLIVIDAANLDSPPGQSAASPVRISIGIWGNLVTPRMRSGYGTARHGPP